MRFDDERVQAVFERYEERRHREDALLSAGAPDTNVDELLLPVGPDTGWFMYSLVLARRPVRVLELGTSHGYSTLFLASAARDVGATVVSMDIAERKQAYARDQMAEAGLDDYVEFRTGDAVELVALDTGAFDVVLLDIWKDLYLPCFDALYPKLSDEAIVVSDNMIFPPAARPSARGLRNLIATKPDMHTALLPIGSGIELSVKWNPDNTKL